MPSTASRFMTGNAVLAGQSTNCRQFKQPTGKLGVDYQQPWRTDMDKDRVEGAAHQVKGAIKEGIGKITGDTKTEAEGAAEKAAGKVQNAVGGAKDAVRDSLKK
jgi:uncharacterized protein YjbJ (UPF0337 family)